MGVEPSHHDFDFDERDRENCLRLAIFPLFFSSVAPSSKTSVPSPDELQDWPVLENC